MKVKAFILALICRSAVVGVSAQGTAVPIEPGDAEDIMYGHPRVIPSVNYDGNEVTIRCDSVINNVDIVIRDQFGNVIYQSAQTITPME